MLPASVTSFVSLGMFRPRISRLCMLCSSHWMSPGQRRSVSLSSQVYENNKDKDKGDLTTQKEPEHKYRKHQFSHPVSRAFGILKDDVVGYVQSRKRLLDDIRSEVTGTTTATKQIEEDDSISKKVYNFDPNTSSVKENFWPSHCDVLVVGGGAVGSSVAYHLKETARDGLSVVVVEQDPNYTRASTVLSVGGIRYQFSVPENILLSMYGMEFLRKSQEWLAVEGLDTPDVQFNPNGYLTLATEKGYDQLRENYELQVDLGAKVSFLSNKELSEIYPWLNTSDVVAGVLGRENEGWFDPWSLLIGMQRKSIALGAQYVKGKVTSVAGETLDDMILEGTAQSNVSRLQTAEVTLPSGEKRSINFAIMVVAAGAWTGEFCRQVGVGTGSGVLSASIPIEPRKRYVYCVHAPDGPGLNSPLVVDPNGTYFRRESLGGLYLCGQSPPEDQEPPIDNLDVDHDYFENTVWPSICSRAPSFEKLKLRSSWAGFYDYNTFDQNGIIGLHPLFSNMFIASGFSGHGIQQAPGVGRAIMECIIHGRYETINLERFGFERVLAQAPLYELNVV